MSDSMRAKVLIGCVVTLTMLFWLAVADMYGLWEDHHHNHKHKHKPNCKHNHKSHDKHFKFKHHGGNDDDGHEHDCNRPDDDDGHDWIQARIDVSKVVGRTAPYYVG